MKCIVSAAVYRPLVGSNFVETSTFIVDKRASRNVRIEHDNMCFIWSLLAHIHPAMRNPNRVAYYKKCFNELNISGLEFLFLLRLFQNLNI
jgi:hypothetical protein